MIKKIILLSTITFLLIGCATLTESQLKAVNDYSKATAKYADFPAAVIAGYIDVQNDIFVLQSAMKANPSKAAAHLSQNIEKKNQTKSSAEKLDISFKLIKVYAKNLGVLASTDYSEKLKENAELLGGSIDTLIAKYNGFGEGEISEGIGQLVKKGVQFLGEQKINKKRAEALKEFVSEGEALIQNVCKTAKTFFKETVEETWIALLNDDVKGLHKDLRAQITADNPYNIVGFIEVDTRVAALYDEIYMLKKLNEALIKSIGNLSKAHSDLNEKIQDKMKLEGLIPALATFMSNVAELTDLHTQLKTEIESNER